MILYLNYGLHKFWPVIMLFLYLSLISNYKEFKNKGSFLFISASSSVLKNVHIVYRTVLTEFNWTQIRLKVKRNFCSSRSLNHKLIKMKGWWWKWMADFWNWVWLGSLRNSKDRVLRTWLILRIPNYWKNVQGWSHMEMKYV